MFRGTIRHSSYLLYVLNVFQEAVGILVKPLLVSSKACILEGTDELTLLACTTNQLLCLNRNAKGFEGVLRSIIWTSSKHKYIALVLGRLKEYVLCVLNLNKLLYCCFLSLVYE